MIWNMAKNLHVIYARFSCLLSFSKEKSWDYIKWQKKTYISIITIKLWWQWTSSLITEEMTNRIEFLPFICATFLKINIPTKARVYFKTILTFPLISSRKEIKVNYLIWQKDTPVHQSRKFNTNSNLLGSVILELSIIS